MNIKRKQYILGCEVSRLEVFKLGGYKQKVLIEGKRKDLPVVICLHGGPGSPVPFSVGCRGLFPEWTDEAVMVFWDQLGCGANNRIIDDSFKIADFVDMTCDLIDEVKKKFPQNKLFLFGMSWGSILALGAASRVPEKIDGVFVYGQILKNLFFNAEVSSAFASAPERVRRSVREIIQTGADCEYKILDGNLKKLYKYLNKYTNAYFNKNAAPAPVGKIVRGLLSSPDYSFKDFRAVMKNGYSKNKSLWPELFKTNLTPLLNGVQVKYLLLQGGTDIVASTATVLKTVEECNNPNVSVRVIENSGHMPSAAAMEECFRILKDFIK